MAKTLVGYSGEPRCKAGIVARPAPVPGGPGRFLSSPLSGGPTSGPDVKREHPVHAFEVVLAALVGLFRLNRNVRELKALLMRIRMLLCRHTQTLVDGIHSKVFVFHFRNDNCQRVASSEFCHDCRL